MKKIFACGAALSLMLIACGDETSSTAPDPSADGESSSSEVALSAGTESSSGGKSSSSSFALPVESSSSLMVVSVDSHHVITDANGQCDAKGMIDDPMRDGALDGEEVGSEEAIPPVVYRHIGTERTGFTLENLSITCGLVVDTLDVNVSGDTIFVKAIFDRTNAMRCICNFKIEFAVENSDAYAQATLLYFDNGLGSLYPQILEIYDMDVISVEDATGRKQAKDIDLSCKNDIRTANAPTAADNTLLPGKIDTTEKASVAGRLVGDSGFDTIVIPEVSMPCGIVFERFDVYASNGMLYVEPVEAPDSPITNCICPTRVSFKIEQNEAFSNTRYLVFGGGMPMPLVSESMPVDGSVLVD